MRVFFKSLHEVLYEIEKIKAHEIESCLEKLFGKLVREKDI